MVISMVQSVQKSPKQQIQDAEGTTVNLGPVKKKNRNKLDDLPRSEHKSQWNHHSFLNHQDHSFFLPTQDVLQTAQDGAP